ncbi:related to 2,4-dienoyl-CoA reductase precursor [Cephalotrichum gorgonifer]|uniref:enoyl-[acyl-carrier-protein] reductase n=1 Tax=Cephalotrichum gorgonifer TaxID=2041049 RepID=A0AAE8MUS1_9PEZI|nr:related to 2,4-dienoyl-CoA reductase precursor [Cephalotrichum gorgonifer]
MSAARAIPPPSVAGLCSALARPARTTSLFTRARSLGAQSRRLSGPYGYTQAKALVYSEYGEPKDVLRLHTHSISPSMPSSTVLVRALAAPINPADINTVQGTYGAQPPFTTDLGTQPPAAVPGNEGVFEVVSTGSPSTGLSKGDWVIPARSGFGTWRTHALVEADALLKIDKEGVSPVQAAQVSVNPCSAYRMLRSYGPVAGYGREGLPMTPLEPGSGAWFIQNGANSGVGRAAVQLGREWGLRSINVIRDRELPEETEALKKELTDLGADVVVAESEFLSRSWRDRLAQITNGGREPIHLGLNCVGGKSATAVARSLADGGAMVSYGGMSKQPVLLPTGALIFKDVRFLGFWLTRWNQKDPKGRKYAVDYLLSLMREGKFRDAPVEEVAWDWETPEDALRSAAQRGLEGFRGKKGMFVFGET